MDYKSALKAVEEFTNKPMTVELVKNSQFMAVASMAHDTFYNYKSAEKRAMEAHRSAAERLAKVADGLEQDGIDASFNTLGELQGRATDLDRLLGELAKLREQVVAVARLVATF